MEEKRKQETKSLNFRVPTDIHKILKTASYHSDKSINMIINELIIYGFSDWVDQNIPEIDVSGEEGWVEDQKIRMVEAMEKTIKSYRNKIEENDKQRNVTDE